tara:strand:- start:4485 stop:4727 length:243 start_codon:yes stop_codon:yes gene_type:complete
MDNKEDKYNSDVQRAIAFIFLISLAIIIFFNIAFFKTTTYEFNTEMFLTLLPFNLIGLSSTLYLVLIIFYNIGKTLIKDE